MNSLGDLYHDGKGITQDYAQARQWYEKAAVGGIAAAMFNLGRAYENGEAVPMDHHRAREWYEKAAAAGDSNAVSRLAHWLWRE
jgi:TPR repeat protein